MAPALVRSPSNLQDRSFERGRALVEWILCQMMNGLCVTETKTGILLWRITELLSQREGQGDRVIGRDGRWGGGRGGEGEGDEE